MPAHKWALMLAYYTCQPMLAYIKICHKIYFLYLWAMTGSWILLNCMYSLKIQSINSTGNITTPLYNFIKLFKVFIIDSFKGATQPLSDFLPHLPSLPCPSPCPQPESEAIYLADSSGALRDDYLSSQTPDAIEAQDLPWFLPFLGFV